MIGSILLAALLAAVQVPDKTELANVNGESVTVQDLLDAFTSRHGGHARFLGGNNEARAFLKILIEQKLMIQEAYAIGLDKDPAIVKMTAEYERSQATDALVRAEVDAKAVPTEAEVREAWGKLNFVVQARRIVVDSRAEAEDIRNALTHGGDAEAIARACSRDETRTAGGRIVVAWGQMDPEWERVIFPLDAGDVSPVMETKAGFEVVLVEGRIEVEHPEFKAVKNEIEAAIHRRKLDQRKKDFSAFLWQKYHAKTANVDVLSAPPDAVVASWEGGSIAVKDILSENERKMFARVPAWHVQREIQSRIRATVNEPLAALEAKERGIPSTPEVADAVQKYREVAMENALFRDHIYRDLQVSDADVAKYYNEHQKEFVEPEQRHVAQVMLTNEAQGKEVYSHLTGGADFAEVAGKYSHDIESRGNGGDLGWISAAKVPEAFNEVLSLSQGAISNPIRSPAGWHIIKVLEIKPKRQQTLDEAREAAKKKAMEAKQYAAESFWMKKLRAAATVEIHDAAIKKFVAAYEFKGQAPPQHGIQ